MTIEQQADILNKTWDQMVAFTGKAPEGSVAPWWEASAEGTKLLLDKGIRYGEWRGALSAAVYGVANAPDHSLQHRDSQAYFVRINDSWKKIDYTQPAASWMEPVKRGEDTGLVEIPVNWDLDDLPPMLFMKTAANSHGFVDAHVIEQKWKDWFEYLWENEREEGFIMPITIHPDVSGRPREWR